MIEILRGIWFEEKTGLPWSSRKSNGGIKGPTYDGELKQLTNKNKDGYFVVWIGRKSLLWHRLLYEHFYGKISAGMQVVHLNNIRDDNRICNLQLLNQKDNAMRQSKIKHA